MQPDPPAELLELPETIEVMGQHLAQLRARYGVIVAHTLLDRAGVVTRAERTGQVLGYSAEQLVGRIPLHVLRPHDRHQVNERFTTLAWEVMQGARAVFRGVLPIVRGDTGERQVTILSVMPTRRGADITGLSVLYVPADVWDGL